VTKAGSSRCGSAPEATIYLLVACREDQAQHVDIQKRQPTPRFSRGFM
jgi:hypothetical protein